MLDGIALGYVVYYVVDAVGGLSDRTEQASFRAMERAGAIPTSLSIDSMVRISRPTTPSTGITQDRTATPSTKTVHAPH
ncbi:MULTISPECIES: hypothetical protein [Pseudomonas syringae group]|uniref:hypothetical protein n=1 Tax=Pseudomonas syringae group TaxID=136849 RepID=UPI001F41F914|nr:MULTISPECIES: hypothetical protein [Pseudomonas syringae group]